MKKKHLLPLLAAIAVIAAWAFVLVVELRIKPTSVIRPSAAKARFDRIQIGMTKPELMEIVGGIPIAKFGPSKGRWDFQCGVDGSIAWITSRDGRVADFGWTDLNQSTWAKLRRWVGLK